MKLQGKKIIVTGADGFIGSHLVEELIQQGVKVKAFVYYNSFNNWGWIDSLEKNIQKEIEIFSGDIRDAYNVKKAMEDCDMAFHLAALIAIPYSYYSPESYVETNVKGTLNVLQAAKELSLQKILVTSTSEIYGTALYTPIDEKHPKQGQSPYSATKIGADAIAESFYRSFNLPITIVRPFNTYGPRQSARAVIPNIIIQLLNKEREIKLGSLHPTRDLVFVKDTVNGFIEIAQSDEFMGEEVNIATGTEISIGNLAKKIIDLLGSNATIVSEQQRIRPEKSEVERLRGDNKKIMQHTKWAPQYSIDEGLQCTIEWFKKKENLLHYKAGIYNV
ncbi:MAG TPA: NAD-dependent 4,6-dehydratase LegB [Chitinophagaceae bacterium]